MSGPSSRGARGDDDSHPLPAAIQPLRRDDLPALLALGEDMGGPEFSHWAISPRIFDGCLATGCSLVAETDGRVVGALLTQALAYKGDTPLTLWVEGVAVHPAYRRRGIATALYRALDERASGLGARAILARAATGWVGDFHRRAGFEPHRDDLLIRRLRPGWGTDEGR